MKRLIIIPLLFLTLTGWGQFIINGSSPQRARMVVAPSNMISNGTFDSGTAWDLSTDCTIAGGVFVYTLGAGNTYSRQSDGDMVGNFETNNTYTCEFDLTSSGAAYFYFTNYAGTQIYLAPATYTTGHQSVTLTTGANIDGGGIRIVIYNDIGFTIDNLTVIKN